MIRYITFNNITSTQMGLTMAGDTQLLVPQPKRSSVEVAYANGTIDTSELNGELYFNDLEIEYVFTCEIPTVYNGTSRTTTQMNGLCNDKIKAIEDWAYSGPATLVDAGLPRNCNNAECQTVVAEKAISTTCWIVKFTLHFRFPFNMSLGSIIFPYAHDFDGRYIVYNGQISSNIGLTMVGSTPLTDVVPKTKYMDWPKRNGSLNLTHCKDNRTHGKDSMFYKDRAIQYKFVHFITNNGDPCSMNVACQNYIEMIAAWLYHHSSTLAFTSVDGNITYGGIELMLIDSGWVNPNFDPSVGGNVECDCLPSARCTGLSVDKSMFPDKWCLTFNVTFTAYPIFSSCELYIPPETSQSHAPVITYEPWDNYGNVYTNERNTKTMMLELPDGYTISGTDVSGLYFGYTSEDFTRSWDSDSYECSSSGHITMSYELDIPEYIDESIPEGFPCVAITMPAFIAITIEEDTGYYIPIVDSSQSKLFEGFTITNSEGTESSRFFYRIIFGSSFSYTDSNDIDVVLYYVGGKQFTQSELETAGYVISLDMQYHYLKYIDSDSIQEDYGIWANEEQYCPNEYYIYTKHTIDLQEMPAIIGTNSISFVPFNKTVVGGDYKFDHPRAYTTQGPSNWPAWLDIPLVNGIGNNYTLCRTAKPEGSDIQWLQP